MAKLLSESNDVINYKTETTTTTWQQEQQNNNTSNNNNNDTGFSTTVKQIVSYSVLCTCAYVCEWACSQCKRWRWLLWETSSHMLHLIRESCSYTYPPRSIAKYLFIQLSELEHCRVKKNLREILTSQHRIRTRVFLVESPKLYP